MMKVNSIKLNNNNNNMTAFKGRNSNFGSYWKEFAPHAHVLANNNSSDTFQRSALKSSDDFNIFDWIYRY